MCMYYGIEISIGLNLGVRIRRLECSSDNRLDTFEHRCMFVHVDM